MSTLTERLPEEILLQVFDLFTLRDLALFSGINRRWRAAVARHPVYFARPTLESTSPSAVAFFIAQITGSRGKSWDVTVVVHEPFPALETAVLPAIASRLDDVEVLTVHVHFSHAEAIFDLLRGSASSLRRLQLYYAGATESVEATLPPDILSYAAPARDLRTLLLQDVDIADEVSAAFQSISNLVFGKKVRESRTTLHALAHAFPAARDVTLTDRALPEPVTASDWPVEWQALESLMLIIGRHRLRRALRCLPLGRVLHLTTMHSGETALACIIPHLQGTLDMCIMNVGWGRFVIHLTSRSNGLVRSFYEFKTGWSPPRAVPHQLLTVDAVMGRVLSITIPTALWNLIVSRMTQCPSVTTLTLVLSDPDWISGILEEGERPADPVFPNLRTLTLAGESDCQSVAAEDVTRLVLERLLPHSPLQVRIQGVDWTGPPRIPPAINSVETIDVTRL
ncbi:hypothetical protein AURDEDRAFT_161475 [Auricularia subglabra TFB-10046 SS5]|nr:hypothetical protein AURDEDRAFT_161475 [Auricularia subglabra TFB-10046 SS5]